MHRLLTDDLADRNASSDERCNPKSSEVNFPIPPEVEEYMNSSVRSSKWIPKRQRSSSGVSSVALRRRKRPRIAKGVQYSSL